MRQRYNRKLRTKTVEIKVRDWAYGRNITPTTTKGPWEDIPFQVIKVYHNQIMGTRQGQESTRDRANWKLLCSRPAQ